MRGSCLVSRLCISCTLEQLNAFHPLLMLLHAFHSLHPTPVEHHGSLICDVALNTLVCACTQHLCMLCLEFLVRNIRCVAVLCTNMCVTAVFTACGIACGAKGALSACQLPFGLLCGAGFNRRTIQCEDVRPLCTYSRLHVYVCVRG